jgi:hypothetical protein
VKRKPILIGLALLAGLFSSRAALADSVVIPKIVRPTPGGDYVLRAELVTAQNVIGLEYDVFWVGKDGRVGEAVEGTTLRPSRTNTRAGVKSRALVIIPGAAIKEETNAALCMWKEPPKPEGTVSSFSAAFRYCKLFSIKP